MMQLGSLSGGGLAEAGGLLSSSLPLISNTLYGTNASQPELKETSGKYDKLHESKKKKRKKKKKEDENSPILRIA